MAPPMNTITKRPTEAWLDRRIYEHGMGYLAVARFKASGEAEIGVFLVDRYCLGVKNAFLSRLSAAEYQTRLVDRMFPDEQEREAITPACARKLVEESIAYARGLGFDPHPDYRLAQRVFGGINPAECGRTFEFGDEGKPVYFQGPHDSPEFVARVLAQLRRRCGEGGYHYVVQEG